MVVEIWEGLGLEEGEWGIYFFLGVLDLKCSISIKKDHEGLKAGWHVALAFVIGFTIMFLIAGWNPYVIES